MAREVTTGPSGFPIRFLGGPTRHLGARRSPLAGTAIFPHWPDPNRHPRALDDALFTSPRSLCISPATGLVGGTELGSCWLAVPAGVRKSPTGPALGPSPRGVRVLISLSLALGFCGGGGESETREGRKRLGPHQPPSDSSGSVDDKGKTVVVVPGINLCGGG